MVKRFALIAAVTTAAALAVAPIGAAKPADPGKGGRCIAAQTPAGLMVPVVKDVPVKSLPQIAREANDLAARCRAGKLKPDELTEGTYTISNNGAYGTVITAPIINPPQVAILSTDAVRKKPVVVESPEGDSIAIRPVGVLAQSFDHRAVDGAYAGAFLRELKLIIETRNWSQDLSA